MVLTLETKKLIERILAWGDPYGYSLPREELPDLK